MQRFLEGENQQSRYKSRFFIFKSCGTLSPAVAPFRSSSPLVGRHRTPFFHSAAPFRSSSPLMGRHCAPRSVPSGTPSDPPLLRELPPILLSFGGRATTIFARPGRAAYIKPSRPSTEHAIPLVRGMNRSGASSDS